LAASRDKVKVQSFRQGYRIHGKAVCTDALSLGWSEEEDCLLKLIRKCSNHPVE